MNDLPVPHVSHEKAIEIISKRHEEVTEYRAVQEVLIGDLELALNIIRNMQRSLNMLNSPDPDNYQSKKLLHKYNMESISPSSSFRILLDGRDITEHPDSIPGTAVDENQLQLEE